MCFVSAGQAMAFSFFQASAMYNDVNKYWFNIAEDIDPNDDRDSRMCWAASAANILKLTNWGLASDIDDGYDLEYTIYHEFLEAFTNRGNYLQTAFDSYLTWHYSDIFNDTTGIETDDYYTSGNKVADLKVVLDELYDGDTEFYGTSLIITNDDSCHAITAWGYEELIGGDLTLYYTDSDDHVTVLRSTIMHQAGLNDWEILLDEDPWELSYYVSLTAMPGTQIIHDNQVLTPILPQDQNLIPLGLDFADVIPMDPINPVPVDNATNFYKGLNLPMPGPVPEPVPEPATILLLSLGLIGLASKRQRLG